jgi:hypothetical protein
MTDAAKRKSLIPAAQAAARFACLVVALLLAQTSVWGFGVSQQHASGHFEAASPSSVGENAVVIGYDESDCAVAAKTPLPNSKGGTGNPFLPDDPYSPESVSRRQSQTRDQMGLPKDPDAPIPDQPPGHNLKSSHQADSTEHHATGERNVGTNEEHSRVAKGSNGMPRR